MELPETESRKIGGSAGRRTSAAFNAQPEAGFSLKNVFGYAPVIGFIVDLTTC